jgi:archaellum biogenesis ATPase FlaH
MKTSTGKKKVTSVTKPSYVMTATEILKLGIKEIPKLIDPCFQQVGLATLCGGSDVGKSFFCLSLALAVCSDKKEFLGLSIKRRHGSAIIVCTEDTKEDLCVRLTSLTKAGTKGLENCRFILETEKLLDTLDSQLCQQPADIVVIDTFGDLFDGHINQSIDVRKFFKAYKRLAAKYKCLILFNHHVGKSKESKDTPDKSDVLGSQGIESACRMVFMLKKNLDGTRVFTVVKGNNIPDEEKNKGLILEFDLQKGFTPTGERISYRGAAQNKEPDPKLIEHVLDLYPKLKGYDNVAKTLRKEGYKIDKNKVGEIWKKFRPSIPIPREK